MDHDHKLLRALNDRSSHAIVICGTGMAGRPDGFRATCLAVRVRMGSAPAPMSKLNLLMPHSTEFKPGRA